MTKFNFGLPPSVIDSVKNIIEAKKMKDVCPKCGKSPCKCEEMDEELKGNQKKLDKNHNGKLDAQDFKMLRKEEVEQIDEISQETKDAYIRKADKQVARTDAGYGKRHGGLGTKGVSVDDFKRKYKNRKAGIKQAMEEVELSAEELARIEEINKGL
jgi:hypothetical protein